MNNTIIQYAARYKTTGEYLYIEKSKNNGDCCGEYTYSLEHGSYEDNINSVWKLNSIEAIKNAIENSSPWYNAWDETCPNHDYKLSDIQIVKLTTIIEDVN